MSQQKPDPMVLLRMEACIRQLSGLMTMYVNYCVSDFPKAVPGHVATTIAEIEKFSLEAEKWRKQSRFSWETYKDEAA